MRSSDIKPDPHFVVSLQHNESALEFRCTDGRNAKGRKSVQGETTTNDGSKLLIFYCTASDVQNVKGNAD